MQKNPTETHECVGKLFQLHTDSLKLKHSLFQFIQRIDSAHIKGNAISGNIMFCNSDTNLCQLFLDLLQIPEKLFQLTFPLIIISPQA